MWFIRVAYRFLLFIEVKIGFYIGFSGFKKFLTGFVYVIRVL